MGGIAVQHLRWLLVFTAALGTLPTQAQLTRGFISGTVVDPSGAVLINATVKITNVETNIERETSTNMAGVYRFVAVEPGTYTVEFSMKGFETAKLEKVTVGTSQEVVLNQELGVGTATTQITVSEATAGVDLSKSSATLQRTLNQQVVQDLPVFAAGNQDRDVTRLALLTPTVNRGPGSTQLSANGQRARNNNFTLDGVDNNDLSVTLINSRVIPESVSEFQVQTSAYSAEFGRNSGAQVNVITRSGGNAIHGDVFDYFNGNWMQPDSLLNKRANIFSTPRFNQNDAGGDIGGPIRKDKLFYFGLIETNRLRQAPDARNATAVTMPTPTGYAALGSVPLGAGESPQARQAVLDSMKFFPSAYAQIPQFQNLTTQTVNGVPIQFGTARIPLANPFDFWTYQGRVDYHLGDKDNLTYRAKIDKQNQPDVISNLQFGSRFSGAQTNMGQNHALSETHIFGARMVNEFRFAFVRRNLDFPENDPSDPTTIITNAFSIGGANNFPQGRIQNTFQWQDIVTVNAGRHSLKFGVDIRRNRLFNRADFESKGDFRFNNFADFMNSQPNQVLQAVNTATADARQTNQYYFAQDDFKVTPTLTLNIGVRYEYSGVPFGFFGAANDAVAAVGVPRNVQPDANNIAPRFGLAWSPAATSGLLGKLLGNGRTVFRGGYGIAYDVLFYNILTVNASNYPRVVTNQLNFPDGNNTYPQLAPRQATVPPLNPLATFVNSPTNMQNPTTHFYSFAIQRQVGQGSVLELGYTGSRSYHQIRQGDTNPGTLTLAQAQTVLTTGNASSIPSLQARRLNPAWGDRVSIEAAATPIAACGATMTNRWGWPQLRTRRRRSRKII
jgi:outer membrane receptor protein involved in Fe transport